MTSFERHWLGSAHGVSHPNGVRVRGDELFVSELYSVKRFQFDAAGEVPRELPSARGGWVRNEVLVYSGATALDDLQPHCGGVIVVDFLGGRLIYMAPDGSDADGLPRYRQALASAWQSLQAPSSVLVGQAPLFGGHDLLVTEKGLIGEFTGDYGNRLSRVKSSVDLNDPAQCARINAS